MANRQNLIEQILRGAQGAYSGTKRAMMNSERGVRDELQGKLQAKRQAGVDALAKEYRGRTADERRMQRAEYDKRTDARRGMKAAEYPRAMAEADYRPSLIDRAVMLRQQIAANNAAPGLKGDLSRGATVAGITGGITASGAALIDLMQYLSQGAEVEGERDEVLSS